MLYNTPRQKEHLSVEDDVICFTQSEQTRPKVHHLTNVRTDLHDVSNCERRCRPTGDVNDYFQVRQGLCQEHSGAKLGGPAPAS